MWRQTFCACPSSWNNQGFRHLNFKTWKLRCSVLRRKSILPLKGNPNSGRHCHKLRPFWTASFSRSDTEELKQLASLTRPRFQEPTEPLPTNRQSFSIPKNSRFDFIADAEAHPTNACTHIKALRSKKLQHLPLMLGGIIRNICPEKTKSWLTCSKPNAHWTPLL